MNNPPSPITGNNNTTLTDVFFSRDIIQLYKLQLGIDVSTFFSGSNTFFLYRCNETGYRFYHPKSMEGDGQFYGLLQESLAGNYYHEWKFENQLALDVIKKGDKVLDIGCGIGNFLVRAKENATVTGLELNEKAIEVCRLRGFSVFNERIETHALHNAEHYDVVCLFQVLEHIYDVKPFLENAVKVLKSGGKLVIGVPNNEPYFLGYDKYCTLNLPPHHMGLWNAMVFERTAPLFGLKMEKYSYDVKGSIRTFAYLKSKYLAHVKSPGGKHSRAEKIKMISWGALTVPLAIIKKMSKGINGSHIAVVFEKK